MNTSIGYRRNPLAKTGGEFDASESRPRKFEFVPGDILEGLVAGFARKLIRESVKRGVAPAALMPENAPQRLRNLRGFATYARDAITSVEVAISRDVDRDDEQLVAGTIVRAANLSMCVQWRSEEGRARAATRAPSGLQSRYGDVRDAISDRRLSYT